MATIFLKLCCGFLDLHPHMVVGGQGYLKNVVVRRGNIFHSRELHYDNFHFLRISDYSPTFPTWHPFPKLGNTKCPYCTSILKPGPPRKMRNAIEIMFKEMPEILWNLSSNAKSWPSRSHISRTSVPHQRIYHRLRICRTYRIYRTIYTSHISFDEFTWALGPLRPRAHLGPGPLGPRAHLGPGLT